MAAPDHTPAPRHAGRGLLPAALLAWHHVGYPAALWAIERFTGAAPPAPTLPAGTPLRKVALVIAAHDEQAVIGAKVTSCLRLDYPRELLQIVVACDGCSDDTAGAARRAGADLVLELPRGGKMAAQHAAVGATDAPVIAFSDANSLWEPEALLQLVGALAADGVGYVCGRVSFAREGDGADNQEGVYWRYEMAIRARESALASVTAGNGAIYAVRREAYADYRHNPVAGHDLGMPFQLVRAGWRCVDVPAARATEKMVPTLDGEFRRKRRMMSHAWPIVLGEGMLDLRGLPPRYAAMLVSHRWLRYFAPGLHAWLAARSLAAVRRSRLAQLLVFGQAAVLAAAARPDTLPAGASRTLGRLARYYVLTQASIALGLKDHLVDGTQAAWSPPEGTR